MRKLILGLSCAVLALGATAPASATTFFSDFEVGGYAGTGFVVLPTYDGWTATAGPGIEVQYGNVAGQAYSGKHLVELDSHSNSSMSRGIDAGDYTLSFYYSDRPNIAAPSNGIDVLLNGISIFSVAGGLGGAGTSWSLQTFTFSTTLPGTNTLTFAALGTSDSLGGYLDDISLSVPEPGTWALMLMGLGIIGTTMRRRKTSVGFA